MIIAGRLPTQVEDQLALVEEARLTWGDEVARLLAEDLGLLSPADEDGQTRH